MSKEIIKAESNIPAFAMSEDELVNILSSSLYPGASIPSIKLVINYCKGSNLDPMQKPVHIVPMWNSKAGEMQDVIMPGIGLYRTQAARGGDYAGVSDPEFGEDVTENIDGVQITYPSWCKVVVKRRLSDGMIVDFSAIERWKENYAVKGGKQKSIAPNAMWAKRPYGQLNKCAEAQALRKAFPEVGAQPTAEEMEGKDIDSRPQKDITEKVEIVLPDYTDEQFKENFPNFEALIKAGRKTPSDIIYMVHGKFQLSKEQQRKINEVK